MLKERGFDPGTAAKTWAALESTRPVSQGGGSGTSVSASVDVPGGSISVSPNSISVAPKVELEGPKGTSLSFSSEARLTQDVTHSGGYTTVTAEGSASVSAGGSIDVGRVGVSGSVGRGHSSSYEVRLTDADYVRAPCSASPTRNLHGVESSFSTSARREGASRAPA